MTELTESDVFAVLNAVAPAIGSDAALRVRQALGLKKLAKFERAITELRQQQRQAVHELAKSREDGYWVQLPHVTKQRIADIDRQIAKLIEDAHRMALGFGWGMTGAFDGNGQYRFSVFPMRELFTA